LAGGDPGSTAKYVADLVVARESRSGKGE
jgi:hypothetical protein